MALYKYDTKDYDLDAIISNAKAGLDDYISTHKVNESKFKDAVLDLLDQMRSGNSTSASNKAMTFNNNFAETRPDGLFRDRYKNNRHYTQGVGYLLKVMSNMSPYEEPKPEEKAKTKVTKQWIGQLLLDEMGNTTTYTDEQKRNAMNKAYSRLSERLNKTPNDFEFEGDRDLTYYTDFLNKGAAAALTDDLFIDDNPYWGELGIANPFYKKPTETTTTITTEVDQLREALRKKGYSDEVINLVVPIIQDAQLTQLLKLYGVLDAEKKLENTTGNNSTVLGTTSKNNGVISYNRLNAGHIYESGGLSDFNQLPAFRRTYTNLVVPQLKDGTWTTGQVTHNNITYNTKDLLGAMVNLSLISDPAKASLGLVKVKRKGLKNGDLYIITKSYNPQNLTAVYYNTRTANFSTGKADLDFVHWANNPKNKSYLKEGGILKFQSGRTIDSPEIQHGFGVIDIDSLDKLMPDTVSGVSYTPADLNTQKEEKSKGNSKNGLLQTLALLTGAASLAPFPLTSYPLGVISGGLSMLDTWTLPELTTAEKWARTGVDALSFIPGGTYARAGKLIRSSIGLSGKADKAVDAAKMIKETKASLKKAKEAKATAEETLKNLGKDADKALKKLPRADLNQANKDIEKYTETLENLQKNIPTNTWTNYAKTEAGRIGANALRLGAIEYGIPGGVEAYNTEGSGPLNYMGNGFYNFARDVKRATIDRDANAADKLWHFGTATLRGRFKGVTTPGRLPATATAAAAATAASASPNKKETMKELRLIPVMADKILISPSLGEASPVLVRGKDTSDENWRKIASVQRPTSGNGIYVYDKNNQQLILSAKDPKTYQLFTNDGNLIKEFPVSDKSITNHLYTTKDGWYGVTSNLFDRMPYLRSDGLFYKKGGKLKHLNDLRK